MPSPVVVQSKSAFSNATTSLTATFASSVTAGNMILVFAGASSTQDGRTFNTPTMTGETFTPWVGAAVSTSLNGQAICWAVNSAVGGQTSVSISHTGGADDIHLHIVEISGQAASPRDAQGAVSSTTLSVSTSGATTTSNDLVIGFFFDDGNNRTFTAGTGFSQVQQTNNTSGGDSGFSESTTVSSTGIQTATASGNLGDTSQQVIVAIAGSSGGGGSTIIYSLLLTGAGPA